MKILILGGSGFVGTRLIAELQQEHEVVIGDIAASSKYPEMWQMCDVCDITHLRNIMAGIDCVVNLAAAHRDDVRPVSLYHEVNVKGAENICSVASELGIKHIVFTSSVAVYGFPHGEYAENAEKNPFNEYGKSKLLAEDVYKRWYESSSENRLHIIRPTVIFGESNRGNVYNLFHQLAIGKFAMIGDGKNRKSMAYVGNVAAFLKWNIENNNERYSVFNYVDKPDYSMRDLVNEFDVILNCKRRLISLPYWVGISGAFCFDMLAFLLRRNFSISSIRVKKFCAQTVFNADKMLASGFVPPYSMPEALKRTIEFEFKK